VEYLELTQRATLEHLVLTVAPGQHNQTPTEDLISSMKGFDRLTQLEIDTGLLHPQGGLQPSLADLLPHSIRSVHIIIRRGSLSDIHQLLRELPRQRSSFPALRSIVVRFADYGSPNESMVGIRPLQEKLRSEGILLQMQELSQDNMQGRLPIIMSERELEEDLQWFFNHPSFVESLN